jgi:hypothetical protein
MVVLRRGQPKESDFLLTQQGVVTDLGRLIYDRRLRSFYYIKLYFKSELSDLYLTVKIQNRMKLRAKIQQNPQPNHSGGASVVQTRQ